MQIPNGNNAVVGEAKVRDYLRSSDHPIGRFKARVFAALGYRRSNWPQLRDDLRAVAAAADAQLLDTTAFSERWMATGTLRGPTGASLPIITIWLIPLGDLGTVVGVHSEELIEVEFVRLSGHTQAVVQLAVSDIRAVQDADLPAVRTADVRRGAA